MEKRKDTTVAISGKRKENLHDAVVKYVIKTRQTITPSKIVHHLVDCYLDDAMNDLIQEQLKEEK